MTATTSQPAANIFAPWLDQGLTVVLDGAMATELERRGANLDDPLWSALVLLENPNLIRDVHTDYLRAGADVITSASYQASIPGLLARRMDESEAGEIIDLSVRLACDARDEHSAGSKSMRPAPLVAASLGPYGAHMHDGSEYHGRYNVSDQVLEDFHRRHIELLCRTDADLIAAETIPGQREAEIIARILEEFAAKPAWISFSCRDKIHTTHGEVFAEAIASVSGTSGIAAAGLNCTAPRFVSGLLRSAAPHARCPLLAYPNTGEAWEADGNRWVGGRSDLQLADLAIEWRAAGARLIGGCCRTDPLDISAIAASLNQPETAD